MLQTKMVEIRDSATFIPAIATRMSAETDAEQRLLRRAGYGPDSPPLVVLTRADGGTAHHDPYGWGDRTWHQAHLWIAANWESLESGGVVDVEYILGETAAPKKSEAW